METLFELTFQDQTLNPQVGTFTDASQATGTFTMEDGEYYLTNGDTKGFYAYSPVAMQSGIVDDSRVIIEFDLKVVTASANTHTIIGTYAGVDGSGIPTGAKITLQYNNGDIELVLGSGVTATLIAAADVVVDQWYHFRIDCTLAASLASTYQVKIDGVSVTTVTGAAADYALGVISVLGTDLHACDECGIKNITLVTETNLYVGRTALDQALTDTKGYIDNQVGACVPLAGSNAISGSLIPSTNETVNLGSSTNNYNTVYVRNIFHGLSSGSLILSGGNKATNGANLVLYGNDRTDGFQGNFLLTVDDGANSFMLKGHQSGTLYWSGNVIRSSTDNTCDLGSSTYNFKMLYTKGITIDGAQFLPSNYVPRSGGAVVSGTQISRTDDSNEMNYCGGTNKDDGATLVLVGKNATSNMGGVCLRPEDGTARKYNWVHPNGTWTWDGQAVQLVSDQRFKQQISEIDDKLLDAWEDVEPVQFKYNDAVDQKKDNARLHTGYVVQQIDEACKKHNVDVSKYGLYCHEVYQEETREVEHEDGTKTTEVVRPANEHYSLRYTEALIVECAYLRKKNKDLQEQLNALSERLEKLENR